MFKTPGGAVFDYGKFMYFFFEAILSGFCGGGKGKGNPGLPHGYREHRFRMGPGFDFCETVRYDKQTKSLSGVIDVTFYGYQVFRLAYAGNILEDHLPFYKIALRDNYLKGIWNGGRGASAYEDNDHALVYSNTVIDLPRAEIAHVAAAPSQGELPRHFAGYELIIDDTGTEEGHLSYSGTLLVE